MILGKNIVAINQTKEMIEMLYELGYKIMECKDCIEGVRQTIRYQPDMVIAEINSPNLNGISMASILNTLLLRVPVILTASEEKYRKYALSFDNVNGFMINPQIGLKRSRDQMRSEFEAIIFNLDNFELSSAQYAYSFRQHEWANLLGKSSKRKLLIIEDDPDFRRLILKKLDSFNYYELYSAKDGLDGVFKALLLEPDLILTDVNMPILDGMAMSQIFYILDKPFPIVFLTAVQLEDLEKKVKKAHNVIGLMEKSTLDDKTAFVEAIDKFLNKAKVLQKSQEAAEEEQS